MACGALAVACCLVAATPATADPALWVARGEQATVYLFGSIHALRAGPSWMTVPIRRALAASRSCWFEVDQAELQPASVDTAMRAGLDPNRPLSSLLTKAERASLAAVVKRVGMPGGPAAVEAMRPWLAAVMLAAADVVSAGYSSDDGVDALILKRCQAAGTPVHGLETAAEQLRGLSEMPESVGLKMLRDVLRNDGKGGASADRLAKAWAAGDMPGLAASLDAGERNDALDAAVFKTRNTAWAGRIAALLEGTETAFVTVGAGHLVGQGNLRDLLQAQGIKVQRIEP